MCKIRRILSNVILEQFLFENEKMTISRLSFRGVKTKWQIV